MSTEEPAEEAAVEAEPADAALVADIEPAAEAYAETTPEVEEQAEAAAEEAAVEADAEPAEASPVAETTDEIPNADAESEPAADVEAAPVAEAEAATEPTAVPGSVEPVTALAVLPGEAVLRFRERMVVVQEQFTNSRVEALTQAEVVVTDAVAALYQTLLDQTALIGNWRTAQPDATQAEDVLRRYRDHLDRVLNL